MTTQPDQANVQPDDAPAVSTTADTQLSDQTPDTTPDGARGDTSPAEAEDQPTQTADPRLVPVSEAIRYRKRAQAAEQQLDSLQQRLQEVETALTESRDTVSALERRQKIDALLADADAVDFEVARLLTESAVESMDEADIATVIDDLRRTKPYLFASRSVSASAMPAHGRDGDDSVPVRAAETAARTGDRRDLLRYLRLRRNGRHSLAG